MAFNFWSKESNFNKKGLRGSKFKNCHLDKKLTLNFCSFREAAIFGNFTLNHIPIIDPSKLCTSPGSIQPLVVNL